jgi:hypothetical protein
MIFAVKWLTMTETETARQMADWPTRFRSERAWAYNRAGTGGWQMDLMSGAKFAHYSALSAEQKKLLDDYTNELIEIGKANPPSKGPHFEYQDHQGKVHNCRWHYNDWAGRAQGVYHPPIVLTLFIDNWIGGVQEYTPTQSDLFSKGWVLPVLIGAAFTTTLVAAAALAPAASTAAALPAATATETGAATAAAATATGAVVPSTITPAVTAAVAEAAVPTLVVAPVAAAVVPAAGGITGAVATAAGVAATVAKVAAVAGTLYKTEEMVRAAISPAEAPKISLPKPVAAVAPSAPAPAAAGAGVAVIGGLALLLLLTR